MPSFIYNEAKYLLATGALALGTDDLRIRPCMTNTTCDTQNDGVADLADFTTIDAHDGANADNAKDLSGESVTKDDANDRAEYDFTDPTWTALGAGTRTLAGFLLYKRVDGTDANDKPVAWIEKTATPDGNDLTVQVDAEGLLHLT